MNEILALETLGFNLRIFALAHSGEGLVQPQVGRVRAPVTYLDAHREDRQESLRRHARLLAAHPKRYLSTLAYVLRHGEHERGYHAGSRWQCFQYAVALAAEYRFGAGRLRLLHAHFAHDPALVAYLAHRLSGLPYSFTAHARDLFQIPSSALIERVEAALAVVTCCEVNLRYLHQVTPASLHKRLHLVPHGVNVEDFAPAERGHPPEEAPLIVSAGRLVPKKGFADLLCALQLLAEAGRPFHCEIYGEGPLRVELADQIHCLGLEDRVALKGAYTQDRLASLLQRAAVFVLTPAVDDEGDRDGIPNVIAEAMACGLPVVSTRLSGIPELVEPGLNGLLVAPHDIQAISRGLASLLEDGATRQRLGAAARRTVVERFDQRRGAARLAHLFEEAVERRP